MDYVNRSAREQKALDKEMGRVDKWLGMIHDKAKWFPDKASNHKKLVERVWKVNEPIKLCHITFFLFLREFLGA